MISAAGALSPPALISTLITENLREIRCEVPALLVERLYRWWGHWRVYERFVDEGGFLNQVVSSYFTGAASAPKYAFLG